MNILLRRIPILNRLPAFGIGKLQAALLTARAGIGAARRAASTLAQFERRLIKLESDLAQVKLMLAGALALLAVLVLKVFAG